MTGRPALLPAHAAAAADVCASLGSNADSGLGPREARRRLEAEGANIIPAAPRAGALRRTVQQVRDGMVLLLVGASVVSATIGGTLDAAIIAGIVVLNVVLGVVQEGRAAAAAEALRDLAAPTATVVRGGRREVVDARTLVTGDLVLLGAGDRVPADARVLSATGAEVDAALLTGESAPVGKRSGPPCPAETSPPQRDTLVHAGTVVVRGEIRAVVTSTGAATELGRIAALTTGVDQRAPLQRDIARLSRTLLLLSVGVCAVLSFVSVLQGEDLGASVLIGVSLAVAAVPEGLASVVTITLALGVRDLAAHGAIVRRLAGAETLGCVTTICTDKTGTLTLNQMRVTEVVATDGGTPEEVLVGALLAVDEHPTAEDRALLEHATAADVLVPRLTTIVGTEPFDTETRFVAVTGAVDGQPVKTFAKGAPEVIAARSRSPDDGWLRRADELAAAGRRVLGVVRESSEGEPELSGFVCFEDPVREDAAASVRLAGLAGIRTIILTGDHATTALAVARRCGLPGAAEHVLLGPDVARLDDEALARRLRTASVVARVTPEQKLRIVRVLQRSGEVVAVTGDGVNDAPALKASDIGVAMGGSGTDAAREAADVVLSDDSFATIIAAVRGGRTIRRNIEHFLRFLLAANLGEVLGFAALIVAGLGAPVTVVQILWVNLLTDGLTATALGVDPPPSDVLDRPPLRDTGLLAGSGRTIVTGGILTAAAFVGAFLIGWSTDDRDTAMTMAFMTLMTSRLAYVLSVRTALPARRGPRNRWLWRALAASAGISAALLAVPQLRPAADAVPLTASQAAVALLLALVPFAASEALKAAAGRRGGAPPSRTCATA